MKLTKKLIPALGMLVLSACMLVTSTFAWFSMNDVVKATNMTVSAKGDQVYLQIVAGKDTAFVNGKAQTSADITADETAELKPTNVKATGNVAYVGGAPIWVSASGADAENAYQLGGYTTVDDLNKYALVNIFKIRLDPTAGANTASGTLRVSDVRFKNANEENGPATVDALGQCVSVLVACTDAQGQVVKAQLYKQLGADGKFTFVGGDNFLAGTKGADATYYLFDNHTTGVTINIYVFFDGDNAKCTLSSFAAASNKYSVDVSFTVTKDEVTAESAKADTSVVAQKPADPEDEDE